MKEFDKIVLPPFDFSVLFEAMNKSLDMRYSGIIGDLGEKLNQVTIEAASLGKEVYQWIEKVNESGAALKNAEEYRKILMNAFRKAPGFLCPSGLAGHCAVPAAGSETESGLM